MAGERGSLSGDAFHQAAVASDGVYVVVEELIAWPVERGRLPHAGHRHPDTGRDARAQRTGRALDSRSPAVFRMARALGIQLAELFQVLQGNGELAENLVLRIDRLDSGQIQHRVEQGRGVAGGQHEAVAVAPDGVIRVEAQELLPHGVDDRRQRHRGSGVPGVGGLHRIHTQRADRVDGELVDRITFQGGEVGAGGLGHGQPSLVRDPRRRSRSSVVVGVQHA